MLVLFFKVRIEKGPLGLLSQGLSNFTDSAIEPNRTEKDRDQDSKKLPHVVDSAAS